MRWSDWLAVVAVGLMAVLWWQVRDVDTSGVFPARWGGP